MPKLISSLYLLLPSLCDTHLQRIRIHLQQRCVMKQDSSLLGPRASKPATMHLQMLNFKHHGALFPDLTCPIFARSGLREKFLGTASVSLLPTHSNHTDSSVRGKTAPGFPDVKSQTHVVSGRWFLGEPQSCCCLKYIEKHLKRRKKTTKNTHSSHFLG